MFVSVLVTYHISLTVLNPPKFSALAFFTRYFIKLNRGPLSALLHLIFSFALFHNKPYYVKHAYMATVSVFL